MHKKKTLKILFSIILFAGIACACSNKNDAGSTSTAGIIERADSKISSKSIYEETSACSVISYVLSSVLNYIKFKS